ncbi:LysR family transcriptional regulator [Streptomyces microflavus]|uniref:LysR family transcriptional regulator n=1 Tax=Streptomyces microflavus TaxID=1919 RepID=UPI0036459CEF
MDPRLPRTLSAVITHGSFCYAARELGYTQSAVSQQTASLEGELGVELACRRPLGPTQAGARLMVRVASILLRIDAARAVVRRVKGKTTGRPTVGICPPAATAHALRIIGEVSRRAGAYELTVRTLPRQAVAGGFATAKPDLGLADGFDLPEDPLRPPRVAGLHGVPVCREPVVVALPAPPPPGTPHGSAAGGPDGRTVDRRTGREPLLADLSAVVRGGSPHPICGWPCGTTPTTYVHRPQDPLALGREQGCRPAELVVTQIPTHRPAIPHPGNHQLANGASRYTLWKGSRQRVAL